MEIVPMGTVLPKVSTLFPRAISLFISLNEILNIFLGSLDFGAENVFAVMGKFV